MANLEPFWFLFYIKLNSYFKYLNRMVMFQVSHSAVPLWETAVALACSSFSWSIHHWRGVLQKDHRKCAHHTTAFRHVQIQWYMSYRETEKRNKMYLWPWHSHGCWDAVDDTRCPNVILHALVWRIKLYQCQDVVTQGNSKTNRLHL